MMNKVFLGLFLVVIMLTSVSFVSANLFDWVTGRVTTPRCTETDGGNKQDVAGVTKYVGRFSSETYYVDYCNEDDKILREYYCNAQDKAANIEVACKFGCEAKDVNGRTAYQCKVPEPACTDSDASSEDPTLVFGYATNELGEKKEDSCSSNTLIEYSCTSDNKIVLNNVACSYKCNGGKCIPTPFICQDSDNAKDPAKPGIVRYVKSNVEKIAWDECNQDKPEDEINKDSGIANGKGVIEQYCDPIGGLKRVLMACEGICKKQSITQFGVTKDVAYCESQEKSCLDTDGKETTTKGIVTTKDVYGEEKTYVDKCSGQKGVIEYFCEGTVGKSEAMTCGDVCQDGACMVRTTLCTDTDKGKDYGIKGIVTGYSTVADFCADRDLLVEFGCYGFVETSKTSAKVDFVTVKCKSGCQEGKCIGGKIIP